jgi:hypothetical protein
LGLLRDKAGLPLGGAPVEVEAPAVDGFYVVLARQLLASSPEFQPLRFELEASSLPWTTKHPTVDVDAVYTQHRRKPVRQKQSEVQVEAESLRNLMRDQIMQLQDELVGRIARADEEGRLSQESIVKIKRAALDANAKISRLSADIHEYKKNNGILKREIERLGSELQYGKDREIALGRHVSAMEAQRDEIFRSHSWRMTRPLRAVKEMLDPATSKKTV